MRLLLAIGVKPPPTQNCRNWGHVGDFQAQDFENEPPRYSPRYKLLFVQTAAHKLWI